LSTEGWTLRNKLTAIGIIISLIFSSMSVGLAGLNYASIEAGKRGDLNFYVEGSDFAIDPYNNSEPYNYALGFRIFGIAVNEGARSIQIESCKFYILLPASQLTRDYYNFSTSETDIRYVITLISADENKLNWNNRVIEVNQQKNLNYTYWGMYDSFYSTLKGKDISASLEITFDDGKGVQMKSIPISEWFNVEAKLLRL
jgi:hypothetical protein